MLCYVLATDLFYGYRSVAGLDGAYRRAPRHHARQGVPQRRLGPSARPRSRSRSTPWPPTPWACGCRHVAASRWAPPVGGIYLSAADRPPAVGTGQAFIRGAGGNAGAGDGVGCRATPISATGHLGPTVAAAVRLPGGETIVRQSATTGGDLAVLPGPANCSFASTTWAQDERQPMSYLSQWRLTADDEFVSRSRAALDQSGRGVQGRRPGRHRRPGHLPADRRQRARRR